MHATSTLLTTATTIESVSRANLNHEAMPSMDQIGVPRLTAREMELSDAGQLERLWNGDRNVTK